MKIEQRRFSKLSGWEMTGDCSLKAVSTGIVIINGSSSLLAEPSVFKNIRQQYSNLPIIINTATGNQGQIPALTVSLFPLTLNTIQTTVINIPAEDADRKAGKLLAGYCSHAGVKSILMLSSASQMLGIEVIEKGCELNVPFTIVDKNNTELISLLKGIHENVIAGTMRSIAFYEELLSVNFGTNSAGGVFELDQRLARSKEKILFQLQPDPGHCDNCDNGTFANTSVNTLVSPICIHIQDATQDEERRKLLQQLEEKKKQLNSLTQELHAANEKVEATKAALDKKNKELEQFAYIASHDLQEPLRMITSFLTQLERKYNDRIDEKGQKYIHFAVDGATRMRQIILDLLEFSRVGRMNGDMEEIDLNELVNETQAMYHSQISGKHATINIGKLPIINGQKILLRKAVQHLLDNALKYTRKDVQPLINIHADDAETHWQLTVADNGIGIEQQYFESIFVIFRRLHTRDEYAGTGMGLAITKKIAENMGGKIWLESEPGKGSTFYLDIPKYMKN